VTADAEDVRSLLGRECVVERDPHDARIAERVANPPEDRTPCIDPVLDGGSFVTEAFSRGRSVSA
jgi:hypothetical protein